MGGAGDHAGAIEPAVVQLRDGRILMMIRTQKGFLYRAFSSDEGLTWTEPEATALGAPNSPCHIRRLASGRLAIAWNNTMATTKGRDSLWIALSDDEAATWSKPVMIARSEQLSYPCLVEVSPGRLMITANHVRRGWTRVSPVVFLCDETDLL
jgi:predicted neuraminidase